MKRVLTIITIVASLTVPVVQVVAVAIAEDTVYLYENGEKIKDSSVLFTYEGVQEPKVCKSGTCSFGQRSSLSGSYTFIKTNNSKLLTYADWTNTDSVNRTWEGYHAYLQEYAPTLYQKTVTLPQPTDTNVYGARPLVVGGIVGRPRAFTVDIKTGEVRELSKVEQVVKRFGVLSSSSLWLVALFFVVVVVGLWLLKFRKRNHQPKGFANLVIIIATLVALSAIASTYLVLEKKKSKTVPELRSCTMEAKQCPDGSYVGRTGPACEFTACPGETTQSADIGVIKSFMAQWNVLQKSIPMQPVLGSTAWNVDYFQFIGNNKLLIAFEDGHIMSAAVFGYDVNNNFNYINTFKDDYPFTNAKWQETIKTYGNKQYTVATYVKQITRGTEVVNFNDWAKVPENVFLKQGEDLSTISTSLTAGWKTYRNEQYGFEVKYPTNWVVFSHEQNKDTIVRLRSSNDLSGESGMPVADAVQFSRYSSVENSNSSFLGKSVYVSEWEESPNDDGFLKVIVILSQPKFAINMGARSKEAIKLIDQILSTFKFIELKETPLNLVWYKCFKDSDCVAVYAMDDICKRECPTNAVNKNYVSVYNQERIQRLQSQLNKTPSVSCPAVEPPTADYCAQHLPAKCIAGFCKVIEQ